MEDKEKEIAREQEKAKAEEERKLRMTALREKLDAFHSTLEQMLSISIPRDFTDAYITFRNAIAPMDGELFDTFEMLPEYVRRDADFFSGSIVSALMRDMDQARRLPNPSEILKLHQMQMEIFQHDVLGLQRLPQRLISWGEQTIDNLPQTEIDDFKQATESLQYP